MSKPWKVSPLLLALLCLLSACHPQPSPAATQEEPPVITIGFSQMERSNPWRTAQINSFRNATVPGQMEFIYHEPEEYTTEWQAADAQKLLDEGVDYLVISPHEMEPFLPVLTRAKELAVPVILIVQEAKGVPQEDYVTLISTDYVLEGRFCAQMLAEQFEGRQCNIVEIYGVENSPLARARSEGFHQEAARHPNLRVISTEYGEFNRITAQKAMENVLVRTAEQGLTIDAVFAHSDEDGLGVLQALKVAGKRPGQDIAIVSINGMQDVCKAVIAGEYLGTVESDPRWGQIVVTLVRMMERGTKPFPRVFLPNRIINSGNAQEIYPSAH